MGLFRKSRQKEEVDEWNFLCRCMAELEEIKATATTDDLIGLSMTNAEDYIEWRKQNLSKNPREFFYRPGAPNIQAMRKSYEELAMKAHEAAILLKRIK